MTSPKWRFGKRARVLWCTKSGSILELNGYLIFLYIAKAMAEAKLPQLLQMLKDLQEVTRPNIYTNQCNVLAAALDSAGKFFRRVSDLQLGQGQASVSLWNEVTTVVHRGIQLLKSCQGGEDWVIRTLLSDDSREEFQDVYTEMCDCVELVSLHLFHLGVQRSKVFAAYNVFKRENSVELLETAAVDDRKQLMKMALKQEEALQTDAMLSLGDQALKLVCTKLLKITREDGFALETFKQLPLTREIGQGFHGTVYEAAWLGHTLAVKVFSGPGEDESSRFVNQLALLTASRHLNVLHIVAYSYDPEQREYSLLTDRAEMDLASYILNPLALAARVSILVQVASGMAWLHSRNVSHQDLQPENILLLIATCLDEEYVTVRISDVGLAKGGGGATSFTAPEVWSSEKYSKKKADVYSFGMLCYHVLTGAMPFQGIAERQEVVDMVRNGTRAELPPDLPTELGEVIRSCWSQDPDNRPRFVDVLNELKAYKAGAITGTNVKEARSKFLNFQRRSKLLDLLKFISCFKS